MLRKLLNIFLLSFVWVHVQAQDNITAFLDSIKQNNPTLQAARRNLAKQEIGFKTGLSLPNPEVEYNHMFIENGEGITELVAAQPFDFPTKYMAQNKLSKSNIESAKLDYRAFEQDFLLQAKLIYLELIHKNKELKEFSNRLKHARIVLDSYNQLAIQGETNMVELNKIKLFVLSIENQVATTKLEVDNLNTQLAELNNGVKMEVNDTIFPSVENMTDYEEFKVDYLNNDAEIQKLKMDEQVAGRELNLSRSTVLPSLAVGYKLESSPGEQLNGVHLGLTIPLWESKNKIKLAKSGIAYSSYRTNEARHVKGFELKALFDSYLAKKQLFEQYSIALRDFNNKELLDISLKAGNISMIEYLTELSMIYDTINEYLTLEKECNEIAAKLLKFKL